MTSLLNRLKNLWKLSEIDISQFLVSSKEQATETLDEEFYLPRKPKMAQIIKKQDRNFLEELNGD